MKDDGGRSARRAQHWDFGSLPLPRRERAGVRVLRTRYPADNPTTATNVSCKVQHPSISFLAPAATPLLKRLLTLPNLTLVPLAKDPIAAELRTNISPAFRRPLPDLCPVSCLLRTSKGIVDPKTERENHSACRLHQRGASKNQTPTIRRQRHQ
jgi:hypothetical protein